MTVLDITTALKLPHIECDITIDRVAQHPDQAHAKSIFVCIRGAKNDGHQHAAEAYANGCRLFVVEHSVSLPADAIVLYVANTRVALAQLACRLYGDPSRRMRIIGITGTKGKTTVASILTQLLNRSGIPCGYIGTNGVSYRDVTRVLQNTTPDPATLQSTLKEMLDADVKTAVLEVSSQGVYQSRIEGICFDTCVYTNLYSDHIGGVEHPDFDHYRACKHRLFTDYGCKTMIYNADDPHAELMCSDTSAHNTITCSMKRTDADFAAKAISPILTDTEYLTEFLIANRHTETKARLPLLGTFNVMNALTAIAVAVTCFDIPLMQASNLLRDTAVTGRTELIRLPNRAFAVIDYAHNGASLEHLLTALRPYCTNRLICLFGSVGERSQLRRRELGDVAARLCDLVILTSDNPGREDPQAIIDEVALSFDGADTPYLSIIDREEAIHTAVSMTQQGDILVLAGKGHENYQLIGREKIPYSDRDVLLGALV